MEKWFVLKIYSLYPHYGGKTQYLSMLTISSWQKK